MNRHQMTVTVVQLYSEIQQQLNDDPTILSITEMVTFILLRLQQMGYLKESWDIDKIEELERIVATKFPGE